MTTMNRATYLVGRWKLGEEKANVKVIVRFEVLPPVLRTVVTPLSV